MSEPRSIDDFEVPTGVVEDLAGVADTVRHLAAEMGGRPYQVFLVWLKFTRAEDGDGVVTAEQAQLSGERDVGRPELLRELELLPRPRVTMSLERVAAATGVEETGTASVEEISLQYSEDVLTGLIPEVRDPTHPGAMKREISFFWEIRQQRPSGYTLPGYEVKGEDTDRDPVRRRFVLDGVPRNDPFSFGWKVELTRSIGDRKRNAALSDTF